MDDRSALSTFSALSQPTRLAAFRLLVSSLPGGMGQGEIAAACDTPKNTMSVHLSILVAADLVSAERNGRNVTYRARVDTARDALAWALSGDEGLDGSG